MNLRSLLTKFRAVKLKFCIFTIVLLSIYVFVFYIIFMEVRSTHKYRSGKRSAVVMPYVVVHIDLKGSPPKLSYLESLLPKLKELGANGLLMEYEDMFPYTGQLENISAKNCYKKIELSKFLSKAASARFEIIPLIQTFGHMEHVLKLEEFQHLREIPLYPDSICPSNIDSINVIQQMLKQVITFHNNIYPLNYIHIGCDEVYHINNCYRCMHRGKSDIDLYFRHLETITEILKHLRPSMKVLIWDDMLRGIKPAKWRDLNFFREINPVYWSYQTTINISHIDLMNYHNNFDDTWIATAFKGADGRTASNTNVTNRFFNHYNWLNSIVDYKFGGESKVYNFKGIILTGWSRYSHMDPPCELLPASLPSLIINLMLIKKFKAGMVIKDYFTDLEFFKDFIDNEFKKKFKCSKGTNAEDFSSCKFEGRDVYILMKEFEALSKNVDEVLSDNHFGFYSVEYYSIINYINMNSLEYPIRWFNKTIKKINSLERKLNKVLSKYYDKYFIAEYINFKTYSMKKRVNNVMDIFGNYLKNHTWKRRPVGNLS